MKLVGGQVSEETLVLARRAVVASDSTLEQVIDGYLHVAAEMADRRRAIVTTAKALTDAATDVGVHVHGRRAARSRAHRDDTLRPLGIKVQALT